MGMKIMGIASAAASVTNHTTNHAAECEMVSNGQIELRPQVYIILHMAKACKVYNVLWHAAIQIKGIAHGLYSADVF